jgi:beta-carotene ketolase (CrtW type)
MSIAPPTYRWKGLLFAALVMGLWALAVTGSLVLGHEAMPPWLLPVVVLVNTFLYTGLFITAHDAMHGTVLPAWRGANDAIGRICTGLYAMFSYALLLRKHHEHHRHPASADDPDFHDGKHPGFLRWYLHFLFTYIRWRQLLGMALAYNALKYLAGLHDVDLLLFWVLPSLLSTVQLFYFGTYRPHREPAEGYTEPHRAVSSGYGVLRSFLTCYHFGYHWEHHAAPWVPWWALPGATRELDGA